MFCARADGSQTDVRQCGITSARASERPDDGRLRDGWLLTLARFMPSGRGHPDFKDVDVQTDANRILIIEDEDDVACLLRSVLEDEGYHVLIHSTGDCIDVLKAFQPDVVITDYMLPMCNGRVVLERIRREVDADLPCILISAMPLACQNWREWGATAFITKPFDLDLVLGVIEAAASEASRTYAHCYAGNYQEQA